MREGLGPDVFQMGIGLLPLSFGIADSFRTTYDNGPTWQEAEPTALIGASGTFQGTVRTAARRWWLGGRVYVSHHDSLHFRNAITDDEARTRSRTTSPSMCLRRSRSPRARLPRSAR